MLELTKMAGPHPVILALVRRWEWRLRDTLACGFSGPVSPRWHRDVEPPARLAEADVREPEIPGNLLDRRGPDAVVEVLSRELVGHDESLLL